jgi:hypothetical protein
VLPIGSLINDFASAAGFIAATVAVGGFLMQAPPALAKADDKAVRAAAVVGGLAGLVLAVSAIAASVLIG